MRALTCGMCRARPFLLLLLWLFFALPSGAAAANRDFSLFIYRVTSGAHGASPGKVVGYASLIDRRGIFITARHVVDEAGPSIQLVSKSGRELVPTIAYAPKDNTRSGLSDWALLYTGPTKESAASFGVDADFGSDSTDLTDTLGVRNGFDKNTRVLSAESMVFPEPPAGLASIAGADTSAARIDDLGACKDPAHVAILADYTYGDSGSALVSENGAVVGIATEFKYADSDVADAAVKAFLPLLLAREGENDVNSQEVNDSVASLKSWVALAEKDRAQRDALSDVLAKEGAVVVIPISCMLREFLVSALFRQGGDFAPLQINSSVQSATSLDELNETISTAMQGANFIDVLQFYKIAVLRFRDSFWQSSSKSEKQLFAGIVAEISRSAGIEHIMTDITTEILADTYTRSGNKSDPKIPLNIIAGADAGYLSKIMTGPSRFSWDRPSRDPHQQDFAGETRSNDLGVGHGMVDDLLNSTIPGAGHRPLEHDPLLGGENSFFRRPIGDEVSDRGWDFDSNNANISDTLDSARALAARAKNAKEKFPALARTASKMALANFALSIRARSFRDLPASDKGRIYLEALRALQELPGGETSETFLPEKKLALLTTMERPESSQGWSLAVETLAKFHDWPAAWWAASMGASWSCVGQGCNLVQNDLRRQCSLFLDRMVSMLPLSAAAKMEADALQSRTPGNVEAAQFKNLLTELDIAATAIMYLPGYGCAPLGVTPSAQAVPPVATQDIADGWVDITSFSRAWTGLDPVPQPLPVVAPKPDPRYNLGNYCYTSVGRFGPGPVNPIGAPCFVNLQQGQFTGQVGP
ncbi:hypothetical protein RFN29_23975 [Mesorhizobium sp. VK22B]|uniref:Serine protease n=1 Tax=Mesorhizobium captivum TaxID=3072319 RepID=A0ABU4Z9C1_9HYPH|nr:hypothetical protein [Mesorhizobium sp. VK22B]MDX8494634.1 hypothetical protein [Mesorhizobium sp. VK22B]